MIHWRLGTMGFSYADWKGVFYPDGLEPADYLSFYARYFDTVELDTTFHATPTVERVRQWAEATGGDFRFCVKTPKDVTHAEDPASRAMLMRAFVESVREFRDKL